VYLAFDILSGWCIIVSPSSSKKLEIQNSRNIISKVASCILQFYSLEWWNPDCNCTHELIRVFPTRYSLVLYWVSFSALHQFSIAWFTCHRGYSRRYCKNGSPVGTMTFKVLLNTNIQILDETWSFGWAHGASSMGYLRCECGWRAWLGSSSGWSP